MSTSPDTLKTLFVAGAVNLHAVEKQALSIMTPQVHVRSRRGASGTP